MSSHNVYIEIYESANNDPFYNTLIDPINDPSYNLSEDKQLLYYKWVPYVLNNIKKSKSNFNPWIKIIESKYKNK
jgi:hypothetical protein